MSNTGLTRFFGKVRAKGPVDTIELVQLDTQKRRDENTRKLALYYSQKEEADRQKRNAYIRGGKKITPEYKRYHRVSENLASHIKTIENSLIINESTGYLMTSASLAKDQREDTALSKRATAVVKNFMMDAPDLIDDTEEAMDDFKETTHELDEIRESFQALAFNSGERDHDMDEEALLREMEEIDREETNLQYDDELTTLSSPSLLPVRTPSPPMAISRSRQSPSRTHTPTPVNSPEKTLATSSLFGI